MIPILYEKTETSFISNGLGRLADCIRCVVTEERNGIFECEFDYPVSGSMFSQIEEGRVIGCTHDDNHDVQPFDIYGRSEPINGVVTFYAHHISYRLNEITVKPFTAGSCAEALSKIGSESVNTNPFTFWTNKSVTAAFNLDVPKNAKDILSGSEGSILDIYGTGEYKYDKFNVNLYLHRGQDTNVAIQYGKNLIDFNNDYDVSEAYTAVVPYWLGGDETRELVMLPEVFVASGHTVPSGREVVVPMDLSGDFEEKPTVAQLRSKATSRLNTSNAWLPTQTIKVNFVQLWQTDEYKDYAPLQRLSLCDTCGVFVPMYGISLRAKVIRVVYNVLLDRYDEMELGDKPSTYTSVIERMYDSKVDGIEAGLKALVASTKTTIEQEYEQAIDDATELIRGGTGGYVVTTVNANGQPIELLITDNMDLNQAVQVWRWNQGGLGHSHNGYNGPFNDVAITQDGKINASMILTGALTANIITAGTLKDVNNKNSWNLDTGQLKTEQGYIGPFVLTSNGLTYATSSRQITMTSSEIATAATDAISSSHRYASRTKLKENAIVFGLADNTESFSSISDVFEMKCVPEVNVGPALYLKDLTTTAGLLLSIYCQNDYQYPFEFRANVEMDGDLIVRGTKSRAVKTKNYSDLLLYAYETPVPMFGDIGEVIIDEDGLGYVDIDDIFSETIADRVEYQVFLQKEGEGDCWISEKAPRYFVVAGTPGLRVAWELKAKQKEFINTRLEPSENYLDEYEYRNNNDDLLMNYITEQEALLYG